MSEKLSTAASIAAPTRSGLAAWIARRPLTAYFILAFLGTWVVFIPLLLSTNLHLYTLPEEAALLIFFLSTLTGPFLAAFTVTSVIDGRPGVRLLWRRIGQWRVGLLWYLVVLFGFPLYLYLALALTQGAGSLSGVGKALQSFPTAYLPLILFGLIMPGIGEETGWRGFALPRLQLAHGPLLASLILGSLHALWHLPAYIAPGFLSPGPFDLVFFIANSLSMIALTIVWTWLFNNARGSILFAMLVHAGSNAASSWISQLSSASAADDIWAGPLVFAILAVLVIALTRGRLSFNRQDMETALGKGLRP